jgi:hypothetical protein
LESTPLPTTLLLLIEAQPLLFTQSAKRPSGETEGGGAFEQQHKKCRFFTVQFSRSTVMAIQLFTADHSSVLPKVKTPSLATSKNVNFLAFFKIKMMIFYSDGLYIRDPITHCWPAF